MRSIIFVHINKTGGSSVAFALGLPMQMHATALEIRSQLTKEQWSQAFKFAYVRNPWDKVVSHYHYRVQTNQTGLGNGDIDFEEWVKRAYRDREPTFYDKPRFFMPQLDWISNESGGIIVDHVGRYENLAQDFNELCNTLGIRKELPHVRQSSHGIYRNYYSDDTQEIIRNCFLKDIEAFGYQF